MRIYEEKGYHAITMGKIAERVELSRAALYLYFRNKDEIMISSIVPHADYFPRVLQKVYDSRESIKGELLEKLWESFQRFYEKDPRVFTASQFLHESETIGNLAA
jgi:AcrR family transcriptional regulator